MILSHRRTELAGARAFLETHAVLHSRYRAHVVNNAGVISDDRLSLRAFERRGALGRPIVTVVLEGAARIEAHGAARWLRAGSVSVVDSKGAIVMRQSRAREPYRAFVLEWDPGSLAGRPTAGFTVHELESAALAVIREAADLLAAADTTSWAAAAALRSALSALPDVSVDDAFALIEEPSDSTRRLSASLDALLSDLRARPMAIDLHAQLGLSVRQLNRVVTEFNARYAFNAGNWRDTRSRRRVLVGVALMSARGVTVEEVAETVGYSSPTAFARALAEASLPPPSEIARVVDRLLASDAAS